MDKISILIPDSEIGHTIPVARSLAQVKNIIIHALSTEKNPAIKYSLRKTSFRKLSTNENKQIVLEDLLQNIKRVNADIVLPIGEEAHRFVSLHREEILKYCKTSPISPVEIFDSVTNKWELAKFLLENKIPCPQTKIIDLSNDIEQQLQACSFPLILKPLVGEGGRGIKMVGNIAQAIDFLETIYDKKLQYYLVQEYIEGYDIDCSLLAQNGNILAYTIQKGFIARGQKFAAPAGIQFLKNDKLFGVVEEFISKRNYSGIAHIDMRYDSKTDNFKIIEVNARFWGSLTGSEIAGVNFPYLTILAGLGIEFERPDYKNGRYIDHTTAVKRMLKEFFSKNKDKVKYKETDLSFIIADPFAEIYNIFKRSLPRN